MPLLKAVMSVIDDNRKNVSGVSISVIADIVESFIEMNDLPCFVTNLLAATVEYYEKNVGNIMKNLTISQFLDKVYLLVRFI